MYFVRHCYYNTLTPNLAENVTVVAAHVRVISALVVFFCFFSRNIFITIGSALRFTFLLPPYLYILFLLPPPAVHSFCLGWHPSWILYKQNVETTVPHFWVAAKHPSFRGTAHREILGECFCREDRHHKCTSKTLHHIGLEWE